MRERAGEREREREREKDRDRQRDRETDRERDDLNAAEKSQTRVSLSFHNSIAFIQSEVEPGYGPGTRGTFGQGYISSQLT